MPGEQGVIVGACRKLGIPSMDIPVDLPTPEVARVIPLEVARELMAVPLAIEEGILTVAMASPYDGEAVAALVESSGYEIFPVLSPLDQLEAALQRVEGLWYGDPCDQPSREE